MKVTHRNPNQTRIDFRQSFISSRKNSMHMFNQKTDVKYPWAVGIVFEYSKVTVIIYHEQFKRGYIQFTRLFFDNALSIVAFVKSMINAHVALGYNISMNGADVAQLYNDIRKVFE